MAELSFAAVLPAVMLEFDLPADKAAALAIPGFVLFGIGALPSGYWADRRGYREALLGYYSCVAVAAVVTFLSQTWWMLAVGLTFLGAAISIYHPVGMGMLSHCSRRGRAMGINGVAGSFGIAIGPAIASLLVAAGYSWRSIYIFVFCFALVGLIITAITRVEQQTERAVASTTKIGSGDSSRSSLATAGVLAVLFATVLIGGFNYRCLTTALPTFLNGTEPVATDDTTQQSIPIAASAAHSATRGAGIVFVVFAMGGIGQLLGGYLADRYFAPYLYILTIAITVPVAFLIAMSTSPSAGVWLASVLAVFMFAQQPLENTMIAAATPAKWRSTIYGLKFILAFGVASSGLYVAGYIWEYHGITRIFAFFSVMACVMACFASAYAAAYRRVFA